MSNLKYSPLSLLLFIWPLLLTAQSPYDLSWKKEGLFYTGGGLGLATALLIGKDIQTLSETEILMLDASQVNSFDRPATRNWSEKAANISDIFFYGSFLLPAGLLADEAVRENYKHAGILIGESLLLTESLTGLTKVIAKRNRPFVYNEEVPLHEKTTRSARLSFFSGHTSTVAVLSFCTAKIYIDHHPESRIKAVVWSAAAALPAATAYLRIKAGKHYPSDVIAGYAVGALSGILIPLIHKKKGPKKWTLSPGMSTQAIGFTLRGRM